MRDVRVNPTEYGERDAFFPFRDEFTLTLTFGARAQAPFLSLSGVSRWRCACMRKCAQCTLQQKFALRQYCSEPRETASESAGRSSSSGGVISDDCSSTVWSAKGLFRVSLAVMDAQYLNIVMRLVMRRLHSGLWWWWCSRKRLLCWFEIRCSCVPWGNLYLNWQNIELESSNGIC